MKKLTPGIECLSFEYHKDDGDISQRLVVKVDLQPNGNFLCVDMSEQDAETVKEVAQQLSEVKRIYLDSIYDVVRAFGVHVKTFSPQKMKDVQNKTADVLRDAESVS